MPESLKHQTFRGVSWSAVERLSVQSITFIIQIVLARLLTPNDYGIVAILTIFIQIAQVFIDSGFANALIQKQNCTEEDYSTVFHYNLVISLVIYVICFVVAPFVAQFYEIDQLTIVMRVITITMVLNSLSIVQRTILVKKIDFKSQSIASLFSALTSGILGIALAYFGYGVWALVYQQIANSFLLFVSYSIITKWHPLFVFNKKSFVELFRFGSRLLGSSLINTLYRNLYTLVIGKKFSPVDLGYYSRAEQFALFPSNNISNIISRVAYPILSKLQDNDEILKNSYRKIIQYSSYIIFPLMFGLIAVADPFILYFLTDKWSGAIIILQILCLDWMFDHISALNLNLLYVKGRSDLVLRLEIIKKTYAVAILLVSLRFGLVGVCIGRVIYSVSVIFINSYYTKRIINLSIAQQMKDIVPYLFFSAIMAIVVKLSIGFATSLLLKLIVGILIGGGAYLIITIIFFKPIYEEAKGLLKRNTK